MKKAEVWMPVADKRVRHLWKCRACGAKVAVEPAFYEESGTPICTNDGTTCLRGGDDMEYVRTEIRV